MVKKLSEDGTDLSTNPQIFKKKQKLVNSDAQNDFMIL